MELRKRRKRGVGNYDGNTGYVKNISTTSETTEVWGGAMEMR